MTEAGQHIQKATYTDDRLFPWQRLRSSSAGLSELSFFHKYLLALIFSNNDYMHDKQNHFAISHLSGLV